MSLFHVCTWNTPPFLYVYYVEQKLFLVKLDFGVNVAFVHHIVNNDPISQLIASFYEVQVAIDLRIKMW